MNYKICIYAICKNEKEWINRWIDNMSEADYIVVLDTGSTDGSYEMLKEDSRITCVEQKIINPWRFDVARNESMKLVPEDTDIFVCTDFDEVFEQGWAQVLRDNWQPEDTRCYYTYAWSHNALGEPQDVFKYDKIHAKNYHWVFPVHEVLVPNDLSKPEVALDAGEHIYLHHLQDISKPRAYYFDLLKIGVEENPTNSHCQMLLAREYLLKQEYDNALEAYEKCLQYADIYEPNKKMVLCETYGRLGDLYYWHKHNLSESVKYFNKWIEVDRTYREPYFCLADIYNNQELYPLAIGLVTTGLIVGQRHYDWVERKDNWIAKGEELLCYSYLGLKDYSNAIVHGKLALAHDPNNVTLLQKYIMALEGSIAGMAQSNNNSNESLQKL